MQKAFYNYYFDHQIISPGHSCLHAGLLLVVVLFFVNCVSNLVDIFSLVLRVLNVVELVTSVKLCIEILLPPKDYDRLANNSFMCVLKMNHKELVQKIILFNSPPLDQLIYFNEKRSQEFK